MKKQILNVSLLLVSSATIVALWALPKQGKDEEGIYIREHKEDVVVEEVVEEKKDSTKNDLTHGKEKKNDSAQDSNTVDVAKKQEQSAHQSQGTQKKAKTKLVKKTVVVTDTLGEDMEIKDVKWKDYGRGIEFRKVRKTQPSQQTQAVKADSTL